MFRRIAVTIALLLVPLIVIKGKLLPDECLKLQIRSAHPVDDSSEGSEPPRGVYHFSDTDRDIETSFKIPDFEAVSEHIQKITVVQVFSWIQLKWLLIWCLLLWKWTRSGRRWREFKCRSHWQEGRWICRLVTVADSPRHLNVSR